MPHPFKTAPPVIITVCLALVGSAQAMADATPSELDALRTKLVSELTFTRRLAVEKLGRLGGDASVAVPDLISALESDLDAMVRTRSAWALGEIKQPVLETVPALLAATRDPNPGVRANALGALHSIGQPAVPQLEEGLKEKDTQIRIAAARTLLTLERDPDEACLAALRGAFDDPSPAIRLQAANYAALAGASVSPLISGLIALLDDPDAGVREVTVATLAQVDRQGASEAGLIRALDKDASKGVKRAAATALGKIGAPSENRIPALLDAFKDSDEKVRTNASKSLAGLGSAAVPPLLKNLTSASASIRELTVDALLDLGPQARPTVDALLTLLGDEPASKVRFRVADALGAIGDSSPKVLDALKSSMTNDQNPTVRAHSAGALRTLTSAESSPANS